MRSTSVAPARPTSTGSELKEPRPDPPSTWWIVVTPPASTSMRAPIALRLLVTPVRSSVSQWLAVTVSLRQSLLSPEIWSRVVYEA